MVGLSCYFLIAILIIALWVVKRLTREECWYRRLLRKLWLGIVAIGKGAEGLILFLVFRLWRKSKI